MFRPIDLLKVDAEERIRNPPRTGRVGEVDMYDKGSKKREEDAKAKPIEAYKCIVWPDYAIAILVEKVAVLLEDCLMGVFPCPIMFLSAKRAFFRRSDVCTSGTYDLIRIVVASIITQ